jgi:phage repressor protein C with HTH and peptisase S24 domain
VRAALAEHLSCEEHEPRHRKVPPRKPRTRSLAPEPIREASASEVLEGFGRVAEIDVRASAGRGAVHEGFEELKQVWYFPEDVIRHELRARISDLRMITIDGDSMEPLLSSGDRVHIDTSQRCRCRLGFSLSGMAWDS